MCPNAHPCWAFVFSHQRSCTPFANFVSARLVHTQNSRKNDRLKTLRPLIVFLALAFAIGSPNTGWTQQNSTSKAKPLSVMAWNIWHGGREDGETQGPQRVIEVIRESGVDIVAMQETYGSGELISKELGFNFKPRGTNVSIHSRYPVVEDISVFEAFKVVGALIELPDKQRVAFYSIWLPYNKEIWADGTRDTANPEDMKSACQASCDDLIKIRNQITERLADQKYSGVPVIIAGDFNSMSSLDYRSCFKDQFGVAIDWATSHILLDAGFRDSYRELNPEVNRIDDRTWTPRFPKQEQDRIDFVYYRGNSLNAIESKVIDAHAEKFPSDHAALVTRFAWPKKVDRSRQIRVASYNIKHGLGNDNRLDIDRTAALLDNLNVDLIGLQEVDEKVRRSRNVDQAKLISKQLGMQAAFGSFMPYGGGNYGLAILSRHPIVDQEAIRLPEGNEPRVALACEIEMPTGDHIVAVNVHFDWVKDDKFRFAQAKIVAKYLQGLDKPYILLGDFNDVRDSRTLKLLSTGAIEAEKPSSDRHTFSATKPEKEIDFIFAFPADRWNVNFCKVMDGKKTSDHRPVVAAFSLNQK